MDLFLHFPESSHHAGILLQFSVCGSFRTILVCYRSASTNNLIHSNDQLKRGNILIIHDFFLQTSVIGEICEPVIHYTWTKKRFGYNHQLVRKLDLFNYFEF